MANLRLDKILSDTGRWSRKEAKDLIRHGRVSIDSQVVTSSDAKFDPTAVTLSVCGEVISHEAYTYIMLHKPAGLLSATQDRQQGTVLDLLSPELQKRQLFPVGRLDKDTTGLLLLTNHGELAHRLLSPRYHIDKVYLAQTDGTVNDADCAAFRQGIVLADGEVCLPATLTPLPDQPDHCLVTLQEGKYHQVKRMLASRGKPVLTLKRLSMGELRLDATLSAGAYRPLTQDEIHHLLKVTAIE